MEYDLKNNSENKIDTLDSGANASLQVIDDKIYYSSKISGVGILHRNNLKTGKTQELSFGTFKDFVVQENGDIIYIMDADDGFGSQIWKYEANGDSEKEIEKIGTTDQLVSEVVAYKDKYIVVSKKRLGSWNINFMEEKSDGEFTIKQIINSPYLEKSIKVEDDNIYFTANYNNEYAIYQFDLKNEKLAKVTSVPYASDGIVNDEELYFVGLAGRGEAIYESNLNGEEYPLPEEEDIEEIDLTISDKENKVAFFKNLSYLFKPYVRFPYLQGEDALGNLGYRLSYLDDFQTSLFMDTYYNAYRSYTLSNYKSNIDGERKLRFDFYYESDDYISNMSIGHDGLYFDIGKVERINFENGNITFKGSAVYGRGKNGIYFINPEIQYSNLIGFKANLAYMHKLLEFQNGLWNPNLFIGDVYGNASVGYYNIINGEINYDQYYPYNDNESHGSSFVYQYELLTEVLLGFNQKVVPGIGARYNNDDILENKLSYYVNLSFPF